MDTIKNEAQEVLFDKKAQHSHAELFYVVLLLDEIEAGYFNVIFSCHILISYFDDLFIGPVERGLVEVFPNGTIVL